MEVYLPESFYSFGGHMHHLGSCKNARLDSVCLQMSHDSAFLTSSHDSAFLTMLVHQPMLTSKGSPQTSGRDIRKTKEMTI